MTPAESKILVLAYGNPGRRDDGLGPALAAALERLDLPGVTIDSDYQLTVEDAAAIAAHDVVVFADADCTTAEPFTFRRVVPEAGVSFSSHSVSPQEVMALAADLLGARTTGYVLGIRGYEFNEFGEGLSARAEANLAAALRFVQSVLRKRTFCEGLAPPDAVPAGAAPSSGVR
jgi:hydrogenase maturation protease